MRRVIQPKRSLPDGASSGVSKKRRDAIIEWRLYHLETLHVKNAVGLTGYKEGDKTRVILWAIDMRGICTEVENPSTTPYILGAIAMPLPHNIIWIDLITRFSEDQNDILEMILVNLENI